MVEVRYIGGPLDGTTGEYYRPLPLALRVSTARRPMRAGEVVTAADMEPGGVLYWLNEVSEAAPFYYVPEVVGR